MQRPTLNPSFHLELAEHAPKPRGPSLFRRLFRLAWRVVAVFFRPLGSIVRSPDAEPDETPRSVRFLRGLVYRSAVAVALLLTTLGCLVYSATHAGVAATIADPTALGLYFENVTVRAADRIDSPVWLIPAVDAAKVMDDPDEVLRKQFPAVVLLHDRKQSRADLLSYLRPLHDAGFVTAVVGLRGDGSQPQTFGLRESLDAAAAIHMLRTRPMVARDRIAVLGVGTGATAALLAAQDDPTVTAVVAVDAAPSSRELLAPLCPQESPLKILSPMTRWAFESLMGVNVEDADLGRLNRSLAGRNVLYLGRSEPSQSVVAHLRTTTHYLLSVFVPHDAPATTTTDLSEPGSTWSPFGR